MNLNQILNIGIKNNASDIHISSGSIPFLRINGDITNINLPRMSEEEVDEIITEIMTNSQKKYFEKNMEIDFSYSINDTRYRVNAYHTINGPAIAMRIIPKDILSIDELKLPSILKEITRLKKGLVLVTGPTGSGKTTTIAAMIDQINQNQRKHIITIEDPVEFIHKTEKSNINQREIGTSSLSFANALKNVLREDPDVIVIGELRDIETINLALTAAETGHLVLATLHTNSAHKTIDRIIDVFPANDKSLIRSMLSGSLEAIISQTLIKHISKKERIAAFETLIANSAIRNLIRDNKTAQIYSVMQVNSSKGMKVMQDSIEELYISRQISKEAAKESLNSLESYSNKSDKNNF